MGLFVYFTFLIVCCVIPTFANVNQMNNVTMKNNLLFYLLMGLVVSCIYPVTVWAEFNEIQFLSNENVSIKIPLTKKGKERTRSILIPPCSVVLLESSLIISFHFLSEDAQIILYSANVETLRVSISQYQHGSEISIPIDCLESGNYTLDIVTASGEHWCGSFEYVH